MLHLMWGNFPSPSSTSQSKEFLIKALSGAAATRELEVFFFALSVSGLRRGVKVSRGAEMQFLAVISSYREKKKKQKQKAASLHKKFAYLWVGKAMNL